VDAHKIFNRWKNYFRQLLNIHGAGDVWQTEMHTDEPFVQAASASEAVVALGKFKRCKSPSIARIPAELIQAGEKTLRSEIRNLLS
jgi:hypothetical protein